MLLHISIQDCTCVHIRSRSCLQWNWRTSVCLYASQHVCITVYSTFWDTLLHAEGDELATVRNSSILSSALKLFNTIFPELCRRQMDSVCELLFVWISQSSIKPLQEHDKYQNLEGHSLRILSENRNPHLHSYQRKLNCHFPFSFPWRGSLKAECWIKEVCDIRETFAELCGGFRSWL